MIKDGDSKPHVQSRHVNRVSSAVWPASIRRVVATGKAAQRRRDWIMQRRGLVLLADALSMRAIFILTTLLVVVSSLLVAALGIHFWYLLLVPLLLFALMLLLPLFLASKVSVEAALPNLSTFAQEFRSSTGMLSLYAQELKSNPGYLQELRSNPGLLSVGDPTPTTPMPTELPLVRVLETYDLREVQVKHLLGEMLKGETGEHVIMRCVERDFWKHSGAELLEAHKVGYGCEEDASSEDKEPRDAAP